MSESPSREHALESFRAHIDEFLHFLRGVRNLSQNTVRAYGIDLAEYCRWVEREGLDPYNISHRQMRRWLAELSQAHYATSTIDRHLSSVRDVYRWIVSEGYSERDCAAALASPKRAKVLPRTMSTADVDRIMESCDDTTIGVRDRAFLEILAATGARISEVSRLNIADIDLAHMQARLFGKGSKERIVPIYSQASIVTRVYIDTARQELLACGSKLPTQVKADANQALFISVQGRRMSADALRTVFKRHVCIAGLDSSFTPHAMRHTYATELLAGGADMRSVQELLGHANLATTQIYTHLSVERLKEATRQAHPRAE